uniref:Uncharacterized protein n=1 Tax=Romanomermis culicivorax TaxID=13658 RepID=A0A915HS44_ROMCU
MSDDKKGDAWKAYGTRKALEGVAKQVHSIQKQKKQEATIGGRRFRTDSSQTKGVAKEKQYLKERKA